MQKGGRMNSSYLLFMMSVLFLNNFEPIHTKYHHKKLRLDRVILATNENPEYLVFWPIAAQAWKKFIGITPTLVVVGNKNLNVNTSLGDVIYFEPIEGIPTSFQAQSIRLLLPALFPNEGCIISDIDQIPLNKNYFIHSIKNVPDNNFVIYRELISRQAENEIPMCYVAAQGKIFQEIFGVKNMADIREKIKSWGENEYKEHQWMTDQKVLYTYVTNWKSYPQNCVRLGHDWIYRKLFHYMWPVKKSLLQSHFIDAAFKRPHKRGDTYNKELLIALKLIKEKALR